MNNNQNIAKQTAQQGDVVLIKINSLPVGEQKIISKKRMVLAEGEVTGHFHEIVEDDSELIKIGEKIILNLVNQSTLTHQEHGHITLDKGLWEVGRVQEYDYFEKMKRQVVD